MLIHETPASMNTSKFPITTCVASSSETISKGRRPVLTVEVVQEGGKFKAALVEVQPLALATPPVGEARLDALAREITRRALYQLLPFSERDRWKDERNGIVARALEFDGMTQADLMPASPEDIVGRFLDMTRRRRGNADTELLKQKIEQLLREYRSTGNN